MLMNVIQIRVIRTPIALIQSDHTAVVAMMDTVELDLSALVC